jgi:hypothetical protein
VYLQYRQKTFVLLDTKWLRSLWYRRDIGEPAVAGQRNGLIDVRKIMKLEDILETVPQCMKSLVLFLEPYVG